MRFSHVVFDLDGTVLDTLADLAASGNHVCEARGWPAHPVDAYKLMVGNGMPKLVERFMPHGLAEQDPRLFKQVFDEFCSYYDAHKEDSTRPYAGIVELLDELRGAGMRLGILTNKDHGAAVPLIRRYFGDRFDCIQGRTDAYPPKPAAPATKALLERLGASADDVVFVGDSNVDVETARNVGAPAIGVLWGFRSREELEGAGAAYIAEKPADVARIVLGS